MKTLKICAVFLLCALLAGCAKQDGYIHYYSYQDKEEKMEENCKAYLGKSVTLIFSTPYAYTLTNAEGQVLIFDEKGLRGDLLLLEEHAYLGGSPDYKIPYSDSFVLTTPSEREQEKDSISITYDAASFSAYASGSTQISIEKAGKVELKGSGQIDAKIHGRISGDPEWLKLEGTGNGCITAMFTEKGAVVKGMDGKCQISYDCSRTIETTYDCDGRAFEIDVVSQPGEILVTPVEG